MTSLCPQRSRTKLRQSWGQAQQVYSGFSSPSIRRSRLAAAASGVSLEPNLKVRCLPLVPSMSTVSKFEGQLLAFGALNESKF